MKALWLAALCGCVALYLASCAAPQRGEKAGGRKAVGAVREPPLLAAGQEAGKAEAKAAPQKVDHNGPKAPVETQAEPKKAEETRAPETAEGKATNAPALFLFSPQRRQRYTAGETAEITLVIGAAASVPEATVTLSMADETGRTWSMADQLGTLAPGRRAMTYGIDTGCFAPGAYKLSARLASQSTLGNRVPEDTSSFGLRDLTIVSAVPRTHFRIGAWIEKSPAQAIVAARWGRVLGLNTVFLPDRSPWRGGSSAKWPEEFQRIRSTPSARPIELETAVPPFIETADLLTGGGVQWIDACAVGARHASPLRPDRSFADPAAVRNAHQGIHHRLLAERAFRNWVGVHFTTESALAGAKSGEYEGPFGVPAQMEAFEKGRFANRPYSNAAFQAASKSQQDAGVTGKEFDWREGAKTWELWRQFMMYRAGILGQALADWTGAARALAPDALVTSHLRSPLSLADGCYPPLTVKGLPIVTAQFGLEGPAGLLMSPMMADLARMGNARKPVWFLPEISDDADLAELRASVFLALGRKVDGVIYPPNIDYHLDRQSAGPLGLDLLSAVGSLSEWLTRYGDLLLALEAPHEDVGILYSVTEHIARIGRDPVKLREASSYPGTLLAAYQACQFAHFPASFLSEDEVLAGVPCKVVLVIGLTRIEPEVQKKLEAHVADGGVVLTDPTTKVAIQGARPLRIEFPDLNKYNEELLRKGEQEKADTTLERRDVVVQTKLIYPLLPPLRAALREHIERAFTASDRDIMTCEQRCGSARYLFIANDTQRADIFRGLKWEMAPAGTNVTLREGDFKIYRVPEAVLVDALRVKGRPVVPMLVPAGGSGLLALLPRAIDHVRISRASCSGGQLTVSAQVRAEGLITGFTSRPINAAVPLEIVVTDPAGQERLRVYRAYTPRGYSETFPLGALAPAGRWKVAVRELFSGAKAEDTFRVRERTATWASRRGPLSVFDGERIVGLLRSSKPLWIVVGTDAEAQKAEGLAAALRRGDRAVEIKRADALAKPRELDPKAAASYLSAAPKDAPMPDVRQPAILVGNVATHALLQAVHSYGLLPRTITPDYPGPGGALVCWLLSAFEPDAEAVVAAAADDAGVDRAFAVLEAAAQGHTPAAPAVAMTGPAAVAPGEPKGERKPQRLTALCEIKTLDDPMDIATPLNGMYFTAGGYDGSVRAYDIIGKELWGRIGPGRVRRIATSLDGSWTLAGAFPRITFLTSKGRPLWEPILDEIALHADFTAAAVSPEGSLCVVGTLSGKAIGLGNDGKPVFNLGGAVLKYPGEEEEPPPKEEKAPPKEEKKGKVEGKDREPTEPKERAEPKEAPPKELKEPGAKGPAGPKGPPPKDAGAKQPAAEAKEAGLGPFGPIGAVAVSPKIEFALVSGDLQTAAIDPGNGTAMWATKDLPRVASLAVSYTEKSMIAVGSRAGFVACVTKEGAGVWRQPTKGPVLSVAFLGATDKVLAACLDGSLACYDEAGKELWSRRSPVGFRCVASTPDGQIVAAAEWSGKVFLLSGEGEIIAETEPLCGVIRGIALSGDGRLLGVALGPATIKLYRLERAQADEDEL